MLLALSVIFIALGVYSCTEVVALDEANIDYSFFVAGHVYGHPQIDHLGIHPALRNHFPKLQESNSMKFGIFTGDIVRTALASQWNFVDAQIDTLGLPVYFAAGNQDVIDRPLYESRYGSTYYSWKESADLFVVLDPNLDSWNISREQRQYN